MPDDHDDTVPAQGPTEDAGQSNSAKSMLNQAKDDAPGVIKGLTNQTDDKETQERLLALAAELEGAQKPGEKKEAKEDEEEDDQKKDTPLQKAINKLEDSMKEKPKGVVDAFLRIIKQIIIELLKGIQKAQPHMNQENVDKTFSALQDGLTSAFPKQKEKITEYLGDIEMADLSKKEEQADAPEAEENELPDFGPDAPDLDAAPTPETDPINDAASTADTTVAEEDAPAQRQQQRGVISTPVKGGDPLGATSRTPGMASTDAPEEPGAAATKAPDAPGASQ